MEAICFTFWAGSVAAMVYGWVAAEELAWQIGLAVFLLHPLVTEMGLNVKAYCSSSHDANDPTVYEGYSPFVFREEYNFKFFGLEHQTKPVPISLHKAGLVLKDLKEKGIITASTKLFKPEYPTREFLLKGGMGLFLLFRLNYSIFVGLCLGGPFIVFAIFPGWYLRAKVLNTMAVISKGSVDAACLAIQHGWAINLAGGQHHGSCHRGAGFSIYPDIAFIVRYMRRWYAKKRVMIIDLDVH
jgi:histone deacetylase 11